MKSLYKKRNEDTSVNAGVLGFGLLIINIHSILALIEINLNFNFGLLNFQIPTDIPKSGFGYMVGAILAFVYLLVINLIKRNIPLAERYKTMKQVVSKGSQRTFSQVYVFLSIILFFFTIYKIAVTIIPEGGL